MNSGVRYTRAVAAPGSPHAGAPRGAAPPPGGPGGDPSAVATAVLLATASLSRPEASRPLRSAAGGPAALLAWEDGTVLGRLLGQLASLGVADVRVITRPAWEADVRAAVEASGARGHVVASPALDGDLRAVAELAAGGEAAGRERSGGEASGRDSGGLVFASADIVTHREALAGLLKDPRIATGVLTGGGRLARQTAFRVRSKRGRVISAASPYHTVFRPTGSFLGIVKVAAADRPALAASAGRLAELAAAPPADWQQELGRKEAMWRFALWRAAHRAQAHPGDAVADDDAEEDTGEPLDDDEYAGEVPELIAPAGAVLPEADEARLRERVAAAPVDVPSLLLVGLVRSGTHVSVSHLRRLFWARALSPAAVETAAERITGYDEDKVLLDSAVKSSDGFFTTFFVSPYSRYIARWCARRGYTPNQVTTVSVLIGLAAAAGFATGQRWGLIAGAVLLQLAFTTDCVDGQLARYTRTFSKLGAWLDSIFDRTKEYLAFAGLAIGASRMGDPVWLLACCTLALQTVRHSADFSFGSSRQRLIGATEQPPVEQVHDAAAAARRARADGGERLPRPAAPSEPPASPAERALRAWQRIDRVRGVRWAKKVIAFPIGERFAAISLTAALFTPRTTFVVLLTWGGVAAAYTLAGRVLRSIAP